MPIINYKTKGSVVMIDSNPFAKDGANIASINIDDIWDEVVRLLPKSNTEGIENEALADICNNLEELLGCVSSISSSNFFELTDKQRDKVVAMQDLYQTILNHGPNANDVRYSMIAWRFAFFLFLKETDLLNRLSEVLDTASVPVNRLVGNENEKRFYDALNSYGFGYHTATNHSIKSFFDMNILKFTYFTYVTNPDPKGKQLSELDMQKRDRYEKVLKQRTRGLITIVEFADRVNDAFNPL